MATSPSLALPVRPAAACPDAVADYLGSLEGGTDPQVLLQRGVDLLPVLVPACHHASVTTHSVDGPGTSTASDATSRRADDLQHQLDEGPRLHAVRTGHSVLGHDLRSESRWPRWCDQAVSDLDLGSVLSVPLVVDGEALATLNLYSHIPTGLTDVDNALVHAMAVPLTSTLQDVAAVQHVRSIAAAWALGG